MKELVHIVDAYDRAVSSGQRAALATVVRVEGSSYRQPGARMLVTEDGSLTGAISGGCLEGDALRKALLVIARNQPLVFTYDTSDENSGLLAVGLGCEGIVHILFEPLESGKENAIDLIRKALGERKPAVLITLFSLTDTRPLSSTCMMINQRNQLTGNVPEVISMDAVTSITKEALTSQQSRIGKPGTDADWHVLADVVVPPIMLVIAGAGNDVIPVVKMADVLGWQTAVLDGRPSHATCRRFPEAASVVVADALHALAGITLDERTAILLMTHNYQYDLAILNQVIDSDIPYIGILGPKAKTNRLIGDLPAEKKLPSCLAKVFGPSGLDLGAETSDEIALSILSEVKGVFAGRNGMSLRLRNAPIHEPVPEHPVV